MAYEPKTWERGEVISADALNHIEQGIAEAGGGKIITPVMRTVEIEGVATPVISIYAAGESGGTPASAGVLFADDFENISVFDAVSIEHYVAKILTTRDFTLFKVEPDYSYPNGVYLISDTVAKEIAIATDSEGSERIYVLPSDANIEYFKGR